MLALYCLYFKLEVNWKQPYIMAFIVQALHDEKVWKHTKSNERKTRQISAITFGWTKEKWDVSWSLLVWIECSSQGGFMHLYIHTFWPCKRGGRTRLKRKNQAATAEMRCTHKPYAFCHKCVHTCSKPSFQRAYLSEYLEKSKDLGLVGKLWMYIF